MKMSRFNIQEHNYTTEFPLYSSSNIHILPRRRRGRRRPLLWVGVTRQSIRGSFSRLTFLPRELSTNGVAVQL